MEGSTDKITTENTNITNDLITYNDTDDNEMDDFDENDFLDDLYLFYQYFIASNYRESVPAPHIHELAVKLMDLAINGDDTHRLAVSMPPRHILADSTPVLTYNRGWTTHGDLKVGDKVFGLDGEPTEIIGLSPKRECDRLVTFTDGSRILAHEGHLWSVYKNNSSNLVTLSTSSIQDGLDNDNTYTLPIPSYPVDYDYLEITIIDDTSDTEMGQCIEIENTDGIYLVGENLIPTHNSKSSMVTLAFPLWLLFQDPNVNIMIVTGSPKLAEKFGIQLREYVRELGAYFDVYLSNVKQASTHIMFCNKEGKLYRGNIMLASSGGGITGQDADYLILDDPYTGDDSEFTPSALQQKIDWINRVVEQRIEPHTKYCVLHTRWHDLSKDTPVYTINKGWITHGELEVDDILLGTNRKHTRVTHVHPDVVCDNVLCFSNGDKLVCGDEHLWRMYCHETDTTGVFTTYELMNSSLYYGNGYVANYTIPVNKSKCISLVDAYKLDKPVSSNCITVEADDGMYLVGDNFTPTHNSNDIIGYYKENMDDLFEFVEFPAISEDDTPLWEERYSLDELLKKKEIVGERVFESVYQQRPLDLTSDFFDLQRLKFGTPEGYTPQSQVRAWDIAAGDKLSDSDFTAGVLMIRYDNYCIIRDLVHGRFGNHVNTIINTTAMEDTPNVHVLIETGVAAAGKLVFEDWRQRLKGFIVERAKLDGKGNKSDRATPFKNALDDGRVYIDIEDPELRQVLLDEMKGFPAAAHDDIVDAISHAYTYLFMNDALSRKVNARIEAIQLW